MSDSDPTQELLTRAGTGDAAAVERLLMQHRDSLRRMIGLRLDPALAARLDASDVVQDVLLEASQRIQDYLRNPSMPFHIWLRHIAKDHIIDAHRKHRRAQRRSLDREQPLVPRALADHSSIEILGQLMDRDLTPASAAMRQELQRRMEQAVTALDEEDREIILLRVYEQVPNQEAAAYLGLSEAAASMRYLRAVRRLQGQLKDIR
jgi:RNA polymerase sigma-70 factor (ECF subfamily)